MRVPVNLQRNVAFDCNNAFKILAVKQQILQKQQRR